jgi:hydrogenase-1 operon protein HyaF
MGKYMSRLSEIPIRIESTTKVDGGNGVDGGLGGGVTAILSELANLLERLATSQQCAAIDVRSLPMSAQDRHELQRVLGTGEVQATLNAEGLSNIRETRVPGVWWVQHHDRHGELVAELIEVTRMPQILMSEPDEIAVGARALRERLAPANATRTN